MSDRQAKILGAFIGLVVGVIVLMVLPMSRNYSECGTVFLCPSDGGER